MSVAFSVLGNVTFIRFLFYLGIIQFLVFGGRKNEEIIRYYDGCFFLFDGSCFC